MKRNGRTIPAVAVYTKQGLLFVFDRVTGKPIFGVEERPVVSDNPLPGDEYSPTQPFPLKPPPIARMTFSPEEIAKVTPEHEAYCRGLLELEGGVMTGGPYAQYGPKLRVIFPGWTGGGNWNGSAFNPDLGYLFTPTQDVGMLNKMVKSTRSENMYVRSGPDNAPPMLGTNFWDGRKSWPCQQPPWGELVAVNVNTGDVAWRVPLGSFEELDALGVPRDRHAESRRTDRNGGRARVHRGVAGRAVPRLRRANGKSSLGCRSDRKRPRRADYLSRQTRQTVCRHHGRRRPPGRPQSRRESDRRPPSRVRAARCQVATTVSQAVVLLIGAEPAQRSALRPRRHDYLLREGILKLLAIKDSDIRLLTLEQCRDAVDKSLHAGGAFSATIPLVTLYYGGFIDVDVADPTRPGQDLFVLSKGHAVAALASIYAELGYFDRVGAPQLALVRQHPERSSRPVLPGIQIATGPMGQGLGVAQGFAIAGRVSPRFDTYALCGDGEMQEGPIWEAVMFAGQKHLDNLCVMVDRNNGQLDLANRMIFPMPDLEAVFGSFNWEVVSVDATQYDGIYAALERFPLRAAQRKADGDHLPRQRRDTARFRIFSTSTK